MSWFKKAQEQPVDFNPDQVTPAAPANPLDGMTPAQAKKAVNRVIPHEQIKGFFSDESWQGIQQIWNAFNDAGLNWNIMDTQYSNDQGVPTGKTWQVQVDYTDRRNKPMSIHGVVRAAGAGSVENPLERYDIVAYFV